MTHSRALLAVLATLAFAGALAAQQPAPNLGRTVEGVVLNALNQPLPAAIVYLKNVRTKAVHSIITDANGAYAFHRLQPNVSYQVSAEWRGHRSAVRTDSQYSLREVMRLDLTIPVS